MKSVPKLQYSYKDSIKSDASDELVNVYLQRPIAGVVTRLLFYTPVSPNQVTLLSTLFGIAGGVSLAVDSGSLLRAGILFYLKDIFDSADGQLARVKRLYSRQGRFFDSIGDFVVNLFLFGGIVFALHQSGVSFFLSLVLGIGGFISVNLRVSYHVFYQTSFLHLGSGYLNNRVTEELTHEDLEQDGTTIRLQKIFLAVYGWQDILIRYIDGWCFGAGREKASDIQRARWFCNPIGLQLNGLFGLGTEFVALTVCFLFNNLWLYISCTLVFFNCLWVATIAYRKWILAGSILD